MPAATRRQAVTFSCFGMGIDKRDSAATSRKKQRQPHLCTVQFHLRDGPSVCSIVRDSSSLKRTALRVLAMVFVVALIAYSAIWMYYVRWHPKAELGVLSSPNQPLALYMTVETVVPRSPAERAGFLPGDQIVRANGRPVHSLSDPEALARGHPGDVVAFEVKRPGFPAPITLLATLGPAQNGSPHRGTRPWLWSWPTPFQCCF